MWAQARAEYSGDIQMTPTLVMTVPRIFIPTVSESGLADYLGAKTGYRCEVRRRPFCQLIQATVFHPVPRLISRTILHPVSVRFTARSSLPSSVKRTGGRRYQFSGCPGDKVRVGSSVGYGMTQDQRWGMLTSFPPLILGSSHAFLKNASNQPSESISLRPTLHGGSTCTCLCTNHIVIPAHTRDLTSAVLTAHEKYRTRQAGNLDSGTGRSDHTPSQGTLPELAALRHRATRAARIDSCVTAPRSFNVAARSARAVQTRAARGQLESLDGPICQGAVKRPQVGEGPTRRLLRVSEYDWRFQLWPFPRPLSGEYTISPSGADTTTPA